MPRQRTRGLRVVHGAVCSPVSGGRSACPRGGWMLGGRRKPMALLGRVPPSRRGLGSSRSIRRRTRSARACVLLRQSRQQPREPGDDIQPHGGNDEGKHGSGVRTGGYMVVVSRAGEYRVEDDRRTLLRRQACGQLTVGPVESGDNPPGARYEQFATSISFVCAALRLSVREPLRGTIGIGFLFPAKMEVSSSRQNSLEASRIRVVDTENAPSGKIGHQ